MTIERHALSAQQRLGDGSGLPVLVPWTHLLWVNPGSPVPAPNGSIERPYPTLQAALNVVTADTLILIGGGTLTESIVMPDVDNVAIVGAGPGVTVLQNNGNTDTFNWTLVAASPTIRRFALANLTVLNTSANAGDVALRFDGNAQLPLNPFPNAFGTEQFRFTNVVVTRSGNAAGHCAFFRRVGFVQSSDGPWLGSGAAGGTTCVNVSQFTWRAHCLLASLDLTYDRLLNQPFGGRTAYQLEDCSIVGGTVTLRGQVLFTVDATSQTRGFTANDAVLGVGLSTVSGALGFGPSIAPLIVHQGVVGLLSIAGSGRVTLPLPTIPGLDRIPYVDFSRSQCVPPFGTPAATLNITCAGTFNPAVLAPVLFLQARLSLYNATGTGPAVGGMGINTTCAVDVRGAFYPGQALFTAGGGTLDRDRHAIYGVANAVGPTATAISPPFPAIVTTNYLVLAQANGVAVATAITARSASSFSWAGTAAAATLDFLLFRAPTT